MRISLVIGFLVLGCEAPFVEPLPEPQPLGSLDNVSEFLDKQDAMLRDLTDKYAEALELAAQCRDRETWRVYMEKYPLEDLPPFEEIDKMRCSMLSRKMKSDLNVKPGECSK